MAVAGPKEQRREETVTIQITLAFKTLFKDKLRHIRNQEFIWVKMYLNQVPTQKWLGSLYQQELGEKFYREEELAKKGNYWTDYSLSGCFIWESTVSCLRFIIL